MDLSGSAWGLVKRRGNWRWSSYNSFALDEDGSGVPHRV